MDDQEGDTQVNRVIGYTYVEGYRKGYSEKKAVKRRL
jgi:hypothetical protein